MKAFIWTLAVLLLLTIVPPSAHAQSSPSTPTSEPPPAPVPGIRNPGVPAPIAPIAAKPASLKEFVDITIERIEGYWTERFARDGKSYRSPDRVVWLTPGESVETACGKVGADGGPGYCPKDYTVVLQAPFFEKLMWPEPDEAIVIVLAHEWAHHVQRLLGIIGSPYWPIRIELQADCLAGNYFNYSREQGWTSPTDVHTGVAFTNWSGDTDDFWLMGAHGEGPTRVNAFVTGFSRRTSCWDFTPKKFDDEE